MAVVNGTAGTDTLTGTGGDDTLTGGGGADTLSGGAGTDIAVFAGTMAEYALGTAGGQVTVTDSDAATSVLSDIEILRFDDGDLTIATSSGAETLVNTTGDDEQTAPRVAAYGSEGGYVVVWTSDGQDGSGTGVYGQLYDSAGAAVGDEFLIPTATTGDQSRPSVVTLSDGRFVVAWQSSDTPGGDSLGIYAQVFDATGAPDGAAIEIVHADNDPQFDPVLCALDDGGFAVSWAEYYDDNYHNAYVATYDGAAAAVVASDLIVSWYTHTGPAAMTLHEDGAVVWMFESNTVNIRSFDPQTAAGVGNQTDIDQAPGGTQSATRMATLANGDLIVVWQSDSDQDGEGTGIYARRVDAALDLSDDFVPDGSEFLVNTTTDGDQTAPAIAALSGGGYVIVWVSANEDGDGLGVYGQAYDADDAPAGDPFQVSTRASGDQSAPTVAGTADGGFVVSWVSNHDGGQSDVYRRAFNADGSTPSTFTVTGSAGNDVLTMSDGSTLTLVGGSGDDTYVVQGVGDTIVELANGGADLVSAEFTYTLADHFENLRLTGSGAFNGTGNAADNVLTGNSGNNTLTGLGGNDTLDGGSGADRLVGGTGNDTFIVDSAADVVVESAGEGSDTIRAAVSYTLAANVEVLILTGSGNLNGTGTAGGDTLTGNGGRNSLSGGGGADTLNGGGGNDVLDGGSGADRLAGGTGNDTFIVDTTADVVVESAGQGSDTVRAAVSHTLAANVEALILTGSGNLNGTGNGAANALTGNGGRNTLSGGGGADTLNGGGGNDVLLGGGGSDTLTGGAGADEFRFASSGDGTDRVRDFSAAQRDRLVFRRAAFGNLPVGTLRAAAFVANANGRATSVTHRFVFNTRTGALSYDRDGSGRAAAVTVAMLNVRSLGAGSISIAASV